MVGYLVDSTNLHRVDYDPWTAALIIEFHGGRVYRYARVPEERFVRLLESSSKGHYFHVHIKNHFPCQRLQ